VGDMFNEKAVAGRGKVKLVGLVISWKKPSPGLEIDGNKIHGKNGNQRHEKIMRQDPSKRKKQRRLS